MKFVQASNVWAAFKFKKDRVPLFEPVLFWAIRESNDYQLPEDKGIFGITLSDIDDGWPMYRDESALCECEHFLGYFYGTEVTEEMSKRAQAIVRNKKQHKK